MAKKLFTFAQIAPTPWPADYNGTDNDATASTILVNVSLSLPVETGEADPGPNDNQLVFTEPAPEGARRGALRTKIFPQSSSPHQGFGLLDVTHDVAVRTRAYVDSDENGQDPDETQERIQVRPHPFQIYEYLDDRGVLYCTTTELFLRQMFRR